MSALAHWLEQGGISTVVIGLMHLHLEKTRPPRALWVPFELGRPLGPPGNAAFQRQVLTTALQLIETDTPGVISPFEHDDPRAIPDPEWHAPETRTSISIVEEVAMLEPAYTHRLGKNSRTAVGVAKIPITDCAKLLDSLIAGKPLKAIRQDISVLVMFRFALDDLKAYYIEAALAQASPSSRQVHDWFWLETTLGIATRQLRQLWLESEDPKASHVAGLFTVPHDWRN